MHLNNRSTWQNIFTFGATLGLYACSGGNTIESSSLQNNATSSQEVLQSSSNSSATSSIGALVALAITTENGAKTVEFTPPAGTSVGSTLTMPSARAKTESQQALELTSPRYPFTDYWQFTKLLPLPDLFCDEPSSVGYQLIAEELGGFRKNVRVSVAKDATTPTFYSGFNDFRLTAAPEAASDSAGGVTIQRPNIVGQLGNKAFYLSDVYGLLTVTYTPAPVQTPKVSCGLPIPGTPKNFVYANNQLYVLTADLQQHIVGVLQFDISDNNPKYIDGQTFHDKDLIDARLFNDTLALYLKTYLPAQTETQTNTQTEVAPPTTGVTSPIADVSAPYYPRTLIGHELKVLATQPSLEVTHSEFFKEEQEENRQNLAPEQIEAPREWSTFNSFLSASGEYLVISESINERFFEGYTSRTYNRCTEYKTTEFPYEYCHTNWKRIENPDYVPLPASGTLSCDGDLYSCLKQRAPSVAKYIRVAEGETCTQSIRTEYQCLQSEYVTYNYPQYRYENTSELHVFRFENGKFTQLENTLATVKDNQLIATDAPLRINGRIEKHDHIRLIDDVLYAITDDYLSQSLQTLSIQGNSAVYIDKLALNAKRYAQLNAVFSSNKLYVSQSAWNNPSNLQTVSLVNPIAPMMSENIKIPTQFQQLLLAPEQLIGIGQTSIQHADKSREYFGTATSFTLDGIENSNFLLGGDYSYYSTNIQTDDQTVTMDSGQNRLIIPYSLSSPLAGIQAPYSQNRVTMISTNDGKLTEENTVNLPQLPNRTLSVDAQSVFTFSDSYIHWLTKSGSWQKSNIFNGELPSEIYYTHQFDHQVHKYERPDSFYLTLVNAKEGTAGEVLDSLTLPRATSQVCLQEALYFDRDRVLLAQEFPGEYITYEDCPADKSNIKKSLKGYRMGEQSFTVITDEQELNTLWTQINWNLVCVLDTNERYGNFISTPEELTDTQLDALSCFTMDQFYTRPFDL